MWSTRGLPRPPRELLPSQPLGLAAALTLALTGVAGGRLCVSSQTRALIVTHFPPGISNIHYTK